MTTSGRAVVLRGDDIDTDRIMPARFLRAVSFDGLEAHVFEDDRRAAVAAGARHPFDDPARAGARVLLVNRNFGCGSSREHAPQALARWGIAAVVGESFAEIFFSNAAALGVPCVTARPEEVEALMSLAEREPTAIVSVDLERMLVESGGIVAACAMPAAARSTFLAGTWDATALLTADFDAVRAAAARLPYLAGFPPAPAPPY
ncbi:MAG: 3-isopropylmalate dehydratase small subunit [Vicinamibacterales bacterium]